MKRVLYADLFPDGSFPRAPFQTIKRIYTNAKGFALEFLCNLPMVSISVTGKSFSEFL